MQRRITIHDIKRLTADTEPYFFARATMKLWNQRLRDFSVHRQPDGRYKISAPVYKYGKYIMHTVRYYNPITNRLDQE